MDDGRAAEILQKAGQRATPARITVLSILRGLPQPCTHGEVAELAERRHQPIDKVTLYRVLDWLVEHGFAHRIAGEDRIWRFNAVAEELHRHAHFHCNGCGKVFCLEDLHPAISVSLPRGYRMDGAEITVQGACPRCQP
jgi:Fur family transcriptional regulator, ferric uptake regulator